MQAEMLEQERRCQSEIKATEDKLRSEIKVTEDGLRAEINRSEARMQAHMKMNANTDSLLRHLKLVVTIAFAVLLGVLGLWAKVIFDSG